MQNEVLDTKDVSLGFTVNSGKNALRIILRSFGFDKNTKIGIPSFCCNEVVMAVKEENMFPVFFDLKSDGTYWVNYDIEKIKNENIRAIIVTHLYGFLHPDTKNIMEMCKQNNVKIIHDVAQSFGIDTSLFANEPTVYSFGPGKSTSAARGGEVLNVNTQNIKTIKPNFWNKKEAEIFFNSRVFGNKISKFDAAIWKLCKRLMHQNSVFVELSNFQKQKALQAKAIALKFDNGRKGYYNDLKNAIQKSSQLEVAYNAEQGLWFKIVIRVKTEVDNFLNYLNRHSIPYVRLADSMNLSERNISDLPEFKKSCFNFVEISTERSIPMSEIKRIAGLLADYK